MKRIVMLLFLSICTTLYANNYGTIKGKVVDVDTGTPLVGVSVQIANTVLGDATDSDGKYEIKNVPIGNHIVVASYLGFVKQKKKTNIINAKVSTLNFELVPNEIEVDELIVVEAQKPLIKKEATSSMRVISGSPSLSYSLNDQGSYFEHNTEEYSKIDETGFFKTINKPLSTFAADIDGASYSNVRRFLERDQLPPKDAVRSEEFINYFSYDYKQPNGKDPLSINLESSECPWNKEHNLIHIGLQGKQLAKEEQKPSNLVFLLDVSGSMRDRNKLPLLKRSFKLLVDQLNDEDKVAIVVYAGNAGLVLPSTYADEKKIIINSLEKLSAGGSTAGGEGIQLAYKVAKENYIKGGNNRVILATDGDFNVGISSTGDLTRYIEEKRDDGIFLTVLGFGMGNYKDDRLQELADRGNGNHAYIDNILEAKKVLVNEVTSTLFTIAKDVKIQVEFNPAKIESYRLIGYENRKLEDKDFTDDTKDAGEIGAGHTVTALYEVVPANMNNSDSRDLKYQETQIKNGAYNSDELMTVKIRYKEPDENKSKEIVSVLTDKKSNIKNSSNNFKFSAALAEFAMILMDSEFKGTSNIESIIDLALSSKGKDRFGYRAEFLTLVERAAILMGERKEASLN